MDAKDSSTFSRREKVAEGRMREFGLRMRPHLGPGSHHQARPLIRPFGAPSPAGRRESNRATRRETAPVRPTRKGLGLAIRSATDYARSLASDRQWGPRL